MHVTVVDLQGRPVDIWITGNGGPAELRSQDDNSSVILRLDDEQVQQLVSAGNRYLNRRMVERATTVQERQTAPVGGAAR